MIFLFTAPVDGTSPLLAETCVSRREDVLSFFPDCPYGHLGTASDTPSHQGKYIASYVFDLASSL